MEELELAASVASRRATAAEAELHRVKQLLDLTDKRAKELAWQVRVALCACKWLREDCRALQGLALLNAFGKPQGLVPSQPAHQLWRSI